MRLRVDQLQGHLTKTLAPAYLITGDEPLQRGEAADALRRRARDSGYTDREVMDVGADFDWNRLYAASDTLSLFADRLIIDLRLAKGKVNAEGAKALLAYVERPPDHAMLLITAPKLEKGAQSSKWLKALERIGVVVQVWPLDPGRLPEWIAGRMRDRGLVPDREAVTGLVERVEGNLLAAAQEIDKLVLLNGPGPVDGQTLAEAVADSARFDVFKLADAALGGDVARTARILDALRGEGVEPPVVLWSLAKDIRAVAAMAYDLERGTPLQQVLSDHHVWRSRIPLMRPALKRHRLGVWRRLLADCANADRLIKGRAPGDPWEGLLAIATRMAGAPPLSGKIARSAV